MIKAVISTGNKQYLVSEGDEINVDLLNKKDKTFSVKPLLIINDSKVTIGKPAIDKANIVADVIETDIKGDKTTSIRYKAKKRVRVVRGHRQRSSILKIKKIELAVDKK